MIEFVGVGVSVRPAKRNENLIFIPFFMCCVQK